ncbi:Signal peptide protein [Hyphomicrobium sp. GJ21]|jgi:hypothetical protein|uniref:hypothetical protein n=1 Tax=Hyphomicrobium sp. GJ21 TaxID=113574 RepID=UPI000622B5C2|nr:hypothetical protein [Hyphomicrobium sp. GJ21]CEJ86012.1 Signal peptide protein [Hyphomicrobium sp. GJ21]
MRRTLTLLAATFIGATLAQTSAQAAPSLVKPGVESTVAKTTFFVDRKKEKHAHARKHKHHGHKHAHLKKGPHKKH